MNGSGSQVRNNVAVGPVGEITEDHGVDGVLQGAHGAVAQDELADTGMPGAEPGSAGSRRQRQGSRGACTAVAGSVVPIVDAGVVTGPQRVQQDMLFADKERVPQAVRNVGKADAPARRIIDK